MVQPVRRNGGGQHPDHCQRPARSRWVKLGRSRRHSAEGLVNDESTAADTIEPHRKRRSCCQGLRRHAALVSARAWRRCPEPRRRLVGGPVEDPAGHGRSGPRRPGGEDLLAGRLGPRCRRGLASQACSARWPARRRAWSASPAPAAAIGGQGQRARAPGRPGRRDRPPARPARRPARRSGAGLRVAGLPSHHPPYWRQTVWTMNSGSS